MKRVLVFVVALFVLGIAVEPSFAYDPNNLVHNVLSPSHCKTVGSTGPEGDGFTMEMWCFNAVSNHVIDDSARPTWVSGGSGPWTISLVSTDPFGNLMPHLGVKFTLDIGGTPYDRNNEWSFFARAVVPTETPGLLTDFWRDTTGSYYSQSRYATEWDQPLPPGMTDPYEIDRYMWSSVPEPATLLFLGLGGLSLLRRKRSKA